MKRVPLTLLALIVLVPLSLSANTLYFPQVAFGGGYSTTFVLINTGTTAISGQVNFYEQGGAPRTALNRTVSIAPGASTRFTIPDSGPLTLVWAEVVAGAGTVQGVATFDLRGGDGVLATTVGVLGLEAGSSFMLPVDVTASGSTGIAVSNTSGTTPVTARLRLIGENGVLAATATDTRFNLAPRAQVADFVTNIFSGLGSSFRGTLVVDASNSANTLAATALSLRENILSALPVLPGQPVSTPSGPAYFPQVAYGGGYSTNFVMMNVGTVAATGQLNFYDTGGASRSALNTSVNIPVGGSMRYSLPNSGPLTVVWAELITTAGSVKGVASFDVRSGSGALTTTAGVQSVASASSIQLPVDVTSTGSTGIAISNINAGSPVNVRLRLVGEDGVVTDTATDPRLNPLGPRRQLADFVTSMFPRLLGTTFRGTLVVDVAAGSPSDPLAATALTVKEGVLSALPVLPGAFTGGAGSGGSGGGGTGGSGGGGSGGSGGGSGGGGGSGAASECIDTSLYNAMSTVHLEYAISGSLSGTSVSDFTHRPNVTFEGNVATEWDGTTMTNYPGVASATTRSRSYQKLEGIEIVNFGSIVDITTPVTGTAKVVFNPPFRDKKYTLGVGESITQTSTQTTTTTLTGLPSLPPQTTTQSATVKYLGRESVTVPAGTFTNACKFEVDNGTVTMWEAAGKGVMLKSVSRTTGANAGTATLELTTATVNGNAVRP